MRWTRCYLRSSERTRRRWVTQETEAWSLLGSSEVRGHGRICILCPRLKYTDVRKGGFCRHVRPHTKHTMPRASVCWMLTQLSSQAVAPKLSWVCFRFAALILSSWQCTICVICIYKLKWLWVDWVWIWRTLDVFIDARGSHRKLNVTGLPVGFREKRLWLLISSSSGVRVTH